MKKSILTLLIVLSTISFLHAQVNRERYFPAIRADGKITGKDTLVAIKGLRVEGKITGNDNLVTIRGFKVVGPSLLKSKVTEAVGHYGETSKDEKDQINYECECLIKTETDKMAGKIYINNKEFLYILDKNLTGFRIHYMKTTARITMVIRVEGAIGYIDNDDKLEILFRDSSRLVLVNEGGFNSDAKFTLYFGGVFGKEKALNELITKEIETIRVWSIGSHFQRDFPSEQSKILMNTLRRLSPLKKGN